MTNEYMRKYRKTHKQKQYNVYVPVKVTIRSEHFDNLLNKCLKEYSQSEISRHLGVSRQSVNLWIKKGLKFPKKIHYEKLLELSDLIEILV